MFRRAPGRRERPHPSSTPNPPLRWKHDCWWNRAGKMVVFTGAVLYTQGGLSPCHILAETLRGGFLDQ